MGVLYSVIPLDKEARDWLSDEGIAAPDSDSRSPTPNELKAILEMIESLSITYNIRPGIWQAQIENRDSPEFGPWTMLHVRHYENSGDEPCEFYFSKGCPELIVRTVFRISKTCGPFLVVPDTGCAPVIVHENSDLEKQIASWEHMRYG